MNIRLLIKAINRLVVGIFVVGLLIIYPSNSLNYKEAWYFMLLLFGPMAIIGLVLFFKAPKLLIKSMDTYERETVRNSLAPIAALMFVIGFIVAGFDHRFNWSYIPKWLHILAIICFILAYIIFALVLKHNIHLSNTNYNEPTLIDTGIYQHIRHPGYLATILMFLSIPLILGSWISFAIFLVFPLLVVKRIKEEEHNLRWFIPDYKDYQQKVRYRLVPFIW